MFTPFRFLLTDSLQSTCLCVVIVFRTVDRPSFPEVLG